MSSGILHARLPISLVFFLFAVLLALSGREFLRVEETPAFYVVEKPELWVQVEGDSDSQEWGVRQFDDGSVPLDVIFLTNTDVSNSVVLSGLGWGLPLESGERLVVEGNSPESCCLQRSWMSAAARICLGIPLDPDKMTRRDWQVLPGIGPKLAMRIELYRQKNGDFGRFEALQAVPGIGPKRIATLRKFFL